MPEACNFIKKETLAQLFSCELCEISMNTFFTEHLWTTSESLRIGPILKNLWFAFIKVTRNKFYYHTSFLRDFFCNSIFDVKTIKFNRFHIFISCFFQTGLIEINHFNQIINYSWKKIIIYNISGGIHSNNISEKLLLFEYFRNMYPCHSRLTQILVLQYVRTNCTIVLKFPTQETRVVWRIIKFRRVLTSMLFISNRRSQVMSFQTCKKPHSKTIKSNEIMFSAILIPFGFFCICLATFWRSTPWSGPYPFELELWMVFF